MRGIRQYLTVFSGVLLAGVIVGTAATVILVATVAAGFCTVFMMF